MPAPMFAVYCCCSCSWRSGALTDGLHGAFGERTDREQRRRRERARNDRTVEHVQPLMHAARCIEHAAEVIDDTAARVLGHRATTERMRHDEPATEHRRARIR